MASKAVEDAVQTYLAANWATTSIFTENQENEAPTDGSPFIILQFPASFVGRPTIDQRKYREEGEFRIVINVARGGGVTTIRQYGETLATLFRDKLIGVVQTRNCSEPFTDETSDRGNYFVGAMTCEYFYLFTG